MKKLLITAFSLMVSLAALAQDGDAEAVVVEGTSWFERIVQGGWAMVPLGVCSLFVLFLAVFGIIQTARSKFVPDGAMATLRDKLQARDVAGAQQELSGVNTVLSRALLAALTKAKPEKPDAEKGRVEETLVENLEVEESAIGQWINYLNVVASVAPMIGLMGTVSGMMGAFDVIGAGGMGRPELLAGDIGEALMTTFTGLGIGIPAMIFYFYLRNRLSSQMILATQAASTLIDDLGEER